MNIEDMPLRADKEKADAVLKLAVCIPRSFPAILLHSGDDYCWIQYYMLKFFELDTIIFIPEKLEIALGKIPDNFWIYRYKDKKELSKLISTAMKRYKKKVVEEMKDEDGHRTL